MYNKNATFFREKNKIRHLQQKSPFQYVYIELFFEKKEKGRSIGCPKAPALVFVAY